MADRPLDAPDPFTGGSSGATPDDHAVAAQLATGAGKLLVELRAQRAAEGVVGKPLGRQGDALAHIWLVEQLATLRPNDAVLSEEGLEDLARLRSSRAWIVDPLDGTREFGEVPRPDWAVHVALVIDGHAAAGAVALPARELTLASDPAPPAPAPRPAGTPLRIVVSRSRPPFEASMIARALDGELLPLGSAGAKAMAVVLGEADVYAHSGGQYEWDSAAPVAVAQAAGLHCSRLDGSPLVYNRPDPYLPDLLICRPELATDILATINRW
ncbi:MAG TPA: 3'(2'),5'-bisphosphate nucleotidase CysQ [Acidimicrobiales bacterium]|jgi:3'(2'), 5'-bisphosphate nucleotidase|nr:3'(2'),5'-bisphosphate nucleotidase CysQ [Acidimicrobiales bacterium]